MKFKVLDLSFLFVTPYWGMFRLFLA